MDPEATAESMGALGPDALGDAVGLEYDGYDADAGVVRAHLEVTDAVLQPMRIVHGGTYSLVAESVCSSATAVSVYPDGNAAMGQSNSATFLRPVNEGTIHCVATTRHRGRTSWVWDVDFTDDADKLCAVVRVIIAVRPLAG